MGGQRKISILQIIDSLPLEGAEILLYDIIQGMDRDRFDFTVCALTRGGGVAGMLGGLGIPVHILWRKSRWDVRALCRLAALIRKTNPDIIHTHLFSSHLAGVAAALLAGSPSRRFHTEHNLSEWKSFWRRFVDRRLDRLTDRIIAVSEPVKDSLVSVCRIPAETVTVIPNGLNFGRLQTGVGTGRGELLKELGLPPASRLVGTASALTPKKGLSFLLAAAEVLCRRPDVYFLLMGEGELKDELARTICEKGLGGRVRLLGSRPDVHRLLRELDVFVLSSVREGLSLALLEAMALGRAVVGTSVGGVVELIQDGRNGLLVPPADPRALAGAIERLLDSASLREELGRAAVGTVTSRFDAQKMVRSYEAVYRDCLRQPRSSAEGGKTGSRGS